MPINHQNLAHMAQHINIKKNFCMQRKRGLRFLLSAPRATVLKILSYIIPEATGKQRQELIRRFYVNNRESPEKVDLADYGTGHLKEIVNHSVEEMLGYVENIVDLGCGNAELSELPNLKTKEYVGIDLLVGHTTKNKKSPNTYYIESAVNGEIDIQTAKKRGSSLFVAVNFLCYQNYLTDFFAFLSQNAKSGDFMLVAEPTSPLLWESYFSGIHMHFRKHTSISSAVKKRGWSQIAKSTLSAVCIGRKGLVPITFVLIFKKL